MNIGCDGRALVGSLTGVGRWTVEVAAGLAERWGHRVVLAASKPVALPDRLRHPAVETLPPPSVPWPGTLWLHTALPAALARAGIHVYLAPLAIVPRRCPVPSVAVVHDVTPRTHPHRHTLANRFCFNAYLEESLERAAVVVASSAGTAELLRQVVPRARRRVVRIPLGVDGSFRPPHPDDDGDRVRRRFAAGRRYLLHLGTLEPRKGLLDLVAAWERLAGRVPDPPDLVLAGGRGWGFRPIAARLEASPRGDRIHLPGYVSDDDAVALLQHAEAFVLASEAEGWGLPLGEAIACGTPCVASDIPPLREVAGDAALFAPSGDPAALVEAIAAALEPATARTLRERAADRAPALRWGPIVDRWHELLTDVAGG